MRRNRRRITAVVGGVLEDGGVNLRNLHFGRVVLGHFDNFGKFGENLLVVDEVVHQMTKSSFGAASFVAEREQQRDDVLGGVGRTDAAFCRSSQKFVHSHEV